MSLFEEARRAARLLKAAGLKVAFAESCSAGLASASLARIPGISEHMCGGVVVYRDATKQTYLGIPRGMLADPGPVSRAVAERMAVAVLKKTPEADVAVSITGHLGPNAPSGLDGVVFVGLAQRPIRGRRATAFVHPLQCREEDSRFARQKWVVEQALKLLADKLPDIGSASGRH